MGKNPIVTGGWSSEGGQFYDEIIKAVCNLSSHRMGALIAVEVNGDLTSYTEEGVKLDAEVSAEMIFSIFNKVHNPLHDGSVIIQQGRISYASCFLPLTVNPKVNRELGTRHRAAIGLSEETDAFVIVVSEETGIISVAMNGELNRGFEEDSLRDTMKATFGTESRSTLWRRIQLTGRRDK